MNRICLIVLGIIAMTTLASPAELPNASPQELLSLYKQLRTIPGGECATVENVILKRDSGTFTFLSGQIVFSAPIAGRMLAARFKGEGRFDLAPPANIDKRQISRFVGSPKIIDTFREAVFYFTDDTFSELSPQLKLQAAPAGSASPFASSQKQYAEEFTDWVENLRKGNPTMRNMPARMLADLSDPESKGFFLADFKAERLGDLLFHISWNRDSLLLPEYGKGEEVILLHLKPGSYYDWVAGYHLASEYKQSPRPEHRNLLAHCSSERIDVQISKDNTLSATAQMDFTVQEGSPRVIPFSLKGVLRISSIEDSGGKALTFLQEDRKLDSDPWIILPEPAKPGQTYNIKIIYKEDSTRDSRIIYQRGSGLYYVTSRESWFPSFGAFDDRTQFEIHARSPKKYTFVASGSLISSEKVKDDLVTHWRSEIPLGVIGFNYGEFVESTQSAANLKVTAYAGRQVPDELKGVEAELSLAQLANMKNGGRDVDSEYGILRGGFNTAANVKTAAGISLQAFRLYDFLFGSLPFKAVSVTEQPVRGYGQSWPNLIFLPYDSLLDATTRNSLGLQENGADQVFYNVVAVHEMAHQWWGHLVGWKTYHDEWLSEGIAEFASSQYLRQFQPKDANSFWSLKRLWLLSKNSSGYRPVDAGPIWMNAQLNDHNQGQNSLLVYDKGAYVMEMLRTIMVDTKQKNPDARFINMMRDFIATYAGKNATTEDFRRTVEKHTGTSMEWFFNQWVYGTEIPTYDFSYQLKEAGGETEVALTLTQSGVSESFQMQLPLYLVVNGEYRNLGLISVKGTTQSKASFKLPLRPDRIVLDPNRSILADIRQ